MLTQVEQEELDQLYEVLMAKYFIHNDEQELLQGHELLNNVPSGWTVVDYQNPGEQADISEFDKELIGNADFFIVVDEDMCKTH